MKIKRKEYAKLLERSRRLETIAAMRFKIRTRDENGTIRELQDLSVEEYAERNSIWEDQPYSLPTWWIGDIRVTFERRIPGYEHFLVSKYTMSSPQTTELNNPFGASTSLPPEYWEDGGKPDAPWNLLRRVTFRETTSGEDTDQNPATEPDSATVDEVLNALATRLKGEETTTASGKTESADSPNESEGNPQ